MLNNNGSVKVSKLKKFHEGLNRRTTGNFAVTVLIELKLIMFSWRTTDNFMVTTLMIDKKTHTVSVKIYNFLLIITILLI